MGEAGFHLGASSNLDSEAIKVPTLICAESYGAEVRG